MVDRSHSLIEELAFTILTVEQSRSEFLIEIEERVEQLFADIGELRAKADDGKSRRELLDRIFRRVHSIKGLAASWNLKTLSSVAHEFESLLGTVRSGKTALAENVLDTLEDETSALFDCLALEGKRRLNGSPLETGSGIPPEFSKHLGDVLPQALWQGLGDVEKHKLNEAFAESERLFVVATSFDLSNFEEHFRWLREKLNEKGEIISTAPIIDAERSGKINFRILFASSSVSPDISSYFEGLADVSFSEVALASRPAALNPAEVLDGKSRPAYSSIRVGLRDLDYLISSTHNLFKETTNTLDDLHGKTTTGQKLEGFPESRARIAQSFLALENEIIRLRMVSLEQMLLRVVRAGRSAARTAGKEIDFELAGETVRLDKLLCDAIGDPLIHLVRNSVDHGIETPDERERAGKSRRGRINVEVSSEVGRTRVKVSDDGRGIDPLIVSRAAASFGLVQPGTTIDLNNSLRLIFRPGFSTAVRVSGVSGRGVGLDVVEASVEQVGGEVHVSSHVGRGTTFELRLPVTFGLLRAAVVASGGVSYCLDAARVICSEEVAATQIETVDGRELVRLRDKLVPVIHISALLGEPLAENGRSERISIVVCEFPGQRQSVAGRAALIVDAIEGDQDVLVRNLGRHGGRWYGIAGAAELRDGKVALVLDLLRLLSGAGLSP